MSTISQRRQEWERQVALAQAARPSRLRLAWQQLSGNKLALVGFIIVLLYSLAAVVGPVLAPNYATQVLVDARLPPLTAGHVLGTDDLGRDMLSRLVLGIRISIAVGLGTTAIALLVGTVAGMIMGYYRGWVDTIVNGFVLMVGALGPGLVGVVLAVGLINWAGFARIIRGEVLVLREREFIASARALGTGNTAIMVKHLLPNVI